jgi:UDP-2,3-diacylglucosamine hydrolase
LNTSKKALFLSDLHLKGADDPQTLRFQRWLEAIAPAEVSHVFLLGDIFDLWVAEHLYFQDQYQGVCQQIRRLTGAGVEVHYFEGNHDFHLTRFWEGELGVRVHPDIYFCELGGLRLRIEHGDLMNPEDTGYLLLRWFWRNPVITWLAHNVPGPVVGWVGEKSSSASRKRSSRLRVNRDTQIVEMMKTHTVKTYSERPFDVLISGHTHVLTDLVVAVGTQGQKARLINLGSWFQVPHYLVMQGQELQFIQVPQYGSVC